MPRSGRSENVERKESVTRQYNRITQKRKIRSAAQIVYTTIL